MSSPESASVRVVNLSEADVARVQAEIESRPESAPAEVTPEAVREALVAVLPPAQPAQAAAPVADLSQPADPAQERVDALLQMAAEKGIDAAHAAAAADEPWVLDELHDALAGSLYEEFRRRGQL